MPAKPHNVPWSLGKRWEHRKSFKQKKKGRGRAQLVNIPHRVKEKRMPGLGPALIEGILGRQADQSYRLAALLLEGGQINEKGRAERVREETAKPV